MKFTLAAASEYLHTRKASRRFMDFIGQVKRVFTFTYERANRLVRYVEIVHSYRAGSTVRDIEDKYGCSRNTVLRYARSEGLPKRPKSFDPKLRSAVISLYKQGKPIAEIKARLGVSQAYISKTATEEGINRRNFRKTA